MTETALTGRFDGATLAAILLVTTGTVFGEPALFVGAAVPLGYVLVGWIATPPAIDVDIDRDIDPDPAAPGERATVTLRLKNVGDTTLTDVRIVDCVPTELPVDAGSPRACLSIRPGETASVTYDVVPSQGAYEFASPVVRARPLSSAAVTTTRSSVTGKSTLICRRDAGDVPQLRGSLRRVGTQPVDRGGEGIEFHSTREYRPGDDIRRVDWRGFAKTGNLATIQFTETSATETVVIVDRLETGQVARGAGYPTASELTVYAADRVVTRLFADGNEVGLRTDSVKAAEIAVPVPTNGDGHPWISPGADEATRRQIEATFDSLVEATQDGDENGPTHSRELHERLPSNADVVLVTPALDESTGELVETLCATDRHVAVVRPISPIVTRSERPSRGLSVASPSRGCEVRVPQCVTGTPDSRWQLRWRPPHDQLAWWW
ncbi:DUF58 domain-containing protein [Halorubrum sp. CBA1125]|uniref:DUF58 domain-containing protein n=1 Tax=Halorubrum sp. CBA1125 TaxID=2668072 RepID=UPI0012E87CE5|nr:DUF58 domain-containing protein [Halorubrum sp. CBA1125]MUW14273.1 DUF58 domain-containing protein [Halorubrum sp. CBA1125]